MSGIPRSVEELRSEIDMVFAKHAFLDFFRFRTAPIDFDIKWKLFAWPKVDGLK